MDLPSKHEQTAVEAREHVDLTVISSSDLDPDNLAKLSYGSNGLGGVLSSPYILGAAFLAGMGGFSFGFDQGVISLILTMEQFHGYFPETAPGHPNQAFYTGFMAGMLELGAFFGCLFFPSFADRYSRKWGLTAATVWFCVGAIIQTAAQDYAMLVVGRTIGGVGVGTLAMGAPLYISEIAPPNLRGSLLVLETVSIIVGAVLAYWLTYGTAAIQSVWAWRLPFLLQMVPALCVGLGIHLFPYSPRWLCMRGRYDAALQSLSKLRRRSNDDHLVHIEWKTIIAEVKTQEEVLRRRHGDVSFVKLELLGWGDLFTPRYMKRTVVAAGVMFFQQFSGINAFVYYAPILFKALGQSPHMTLILSGVINIAQLTGAVAAFTFLDKVGRRKLAIAGGIMMGIPHVILAGLVGTYNSSWQENPTSAYFAVVLIYVYLLMYGLSYGPLGWTLPAEVWPNAVRAKGVGLAVATNWAANTCIGFSVPPMIAAINWGTYVFFAFFCFLASVFAYFLVPEVANLSLEQIDKLFEDNSAEEERELRRNIVQQLK